MANYTGRVTREVEIPARTIPAQFIQCAACGKQDETSNNGRGLFWRMIPPVAGWDNSEENWACLACLNKINEIFGVPAKELHSVPHFND